MGSPTSMSWVSSGSLVVLDKTHRRLFAWADGDGKAVVRWLVQLETGAGELLERLGAIAKALRRLNEAPRTVHRPTRSDEEVAEVPPLLHVLAKLVFGRARDVRIDA